MLLQQRASAATPTTLTSALASPVAPSAIAASVAAAIAATAVSATRDGMDPRRSGCNLHDGVCVGRIALHRQRDGRSLERGEHWSRGGGDAAIHRRVVVDQFELHSEYGDDGCQPTSTAFSFFVLLSAICEHVRCLAELQRR